MPSSYKVDRDRSRDMSKRVEGLNKHCFRNSFTGLTMGGLLRFKGANNLRYVEGWVIVPSFPIVAEHAWLIDEEEGVIIDPTPCYHGDDLATYFPSVVYDRDKLSRAVAVSDHMPFTPHLDLDAWRRAFWEAQVWNLGREAVLFLHRNLSEKDRQFVDEAEDNPETGKAVVHG